MFALRAAHVPSPWRSSLCLFLHARPGLTDPAAMPYIERSVRGATLNLRWLMAYRQSIGLAPTPEPILPPLALQIAAAPLHLAIMADASFPFPALGVVHVSQRVVQTRPVFANCPFDLLTYTTDARPEKRGTSFGLVTEVCCEGELAWHSETRALSVVTRGRKHKGGNVSGHRRDRQSEEIADRPFSIEHSLAVPESCGRRYARIAGDLNPIHQHALLARPFGYKRAIVHGTWTLARALALFDWSQRNAFTLDAKFLRPVELPSKILVQMSNESTTRLQRVEVVRPADGKCHVEIAVTEASAPHASVFQFMRGRPQ